MIGGWRIIVAALASAALMLAFCATPPPVSIPDCRVVTALPGIVDLDSERSGGRPLRLLASVQDQSLRDPNGEFLRSGEIVAIALNSDSPRVEPLRIEGRDDWPFHPLGIHFVEFRGRPNLLFVINRAKAERYAIEVFRLQGSRLSFVERIRSRAIRQPVDIVAIDRGRFFVLNRRGSLLSKAALLDFAGDRIVQNPAPSMETGALLLENHAIVVAGDDSAQRYRIENGGQQLSLAATFTSPGPAVHLQSAPGDRLLLAAAGNPGGVYVSQTSGAEWRPLLRGDRLHTNQLRASLLIQNRLYVARAQAPALSICPAPSLA